jgi:hypothetical protein
MHNAERKDDISKTELAVLMSFLKAKDLDHKMRRDKAGERIAIFKDDWLDILDGRLKQRFHPDNYKNIKLEKDTSHNILKQVIGEISTIYDTPPVRTFLLNENPFEMPFDYDQIVRNAFMNDINAYMNLLNDILIYVKYSESNESIGLKMITPDIAEVKQNPLNPNEADIIAFEVELIDTRDAGASYYVVWSKDSHFHLEYTDGKWNPKPPIDEKGNPVNAGMINFYKELPFVCIHKNQNNAYFWDMTSGNDLIEGCLLNAESKTGKRYRLKTQSYKQPYIIGSLDTGAEKRTDPLSLWEVSGEGASVGIVDLNVNHADFDQALNKDINDTLSTYGLTQDDFTIRQHSSGVALEIKSRPLMRIRKRQIEIFREAERKLFDVIRTVYNYHKPGKMIPEELEIQVDFAEIEPFRDPMQKIEYYKMQLETGIISKGQFYQQFNPDVIDEKEAGEILTKNLDEFNKLKTDYPDIMSLFKSPGKEKPIQ